ncbi:MAG: hypothetical protein ACKPKO_45845, partial [Candidatus Fonsibacter sp.]
MARQIDLLQTGATLLGLEVGEDPKATECQSRDVCVDYDIIDHFWKYFLIKHASERLHGILIWTVFV